MLIDQNKAIARRIVEEGWNKHDPSVLDTLFSNDATLHDPQNKSIAKGPQGAKSTLATYLKAFPDMKISIERDIAEGRGVQRHAGDRQEHERHRRHDEQDQGRQGRRGLVAL